MTPPPIRVLIVDDSAFARKVLRELLGASEGILVVGTARDGIDALEQIAALAPDVITLDLQMPNLDGLGVLAALPKGGPRAVVVSMADEQSDPALAALEAGAVDVVHKPTALATDRLYELGTELVAKVRAAAVASPRKSVPPGPGLAAPAAPAVAAPRPVPLAAPRRPRGDIQIVVIGASTGGPQALARLLVDLPGDLPVPLAMALHIPAGYTAALARRMDARSALLVVEAEEGLLLEPGVAAVARAGMHLQVVADGELPPAPGAPPRARAHLDVEPLGVPHHPSVDVLFASAAEVFGRAVLGVVLTGMGNDGCAGARAIREAGGLVLTEAESSCVVYGMPRAVAEAGLSSGVFPLDQMAEEILRRL